MIYKIYQSELNLEEAFKDAENLFNTRVFKHNEDQLFVTEY
jgi:phage terminase large subunit-like protein